MSTLAPFALEMGLGALLLVVFGFAPGLALVPVDTATVPLLSRILQP